MAFVAWRTWVASAMVTAAQMNQDVRDNLNAWFPLAATSGVAWKTFSPTLTQSGTVTKTDTYTKYQQIGKTIDFVYVLTVTGTGTGNAKVTVTLPVTAATGFIAAPIGTGEVFDTSTGFVTPGMTELESTTTAGMLDTSQQTAAATSVLGLTGTPFSVALASGDVVRISGRYEAA